MKDGPQNRGYQPRAAWTMTAMLLLFMLVNFLDKVALGMVAVPLMEELHMSPARFGLIAGGFYWLFSISAIIVGLLSARIPTRWMLVAMGVAWAVLQLPIAFAGGAFTILLCRILLGVAEGPAFPVSVHALYKWFPDEKRGLPVAVISQGACLGLLMAGMLIPLITHRWGWRMNFVALGAAGAIWSAMWACFGREGPLDGRHSRNNAIKAGSNAPTVQVPYRKILCDPSVLALFLLGFSAYWMLGLMLTWLPAYLQRGLGFDSTSAGRWFALVVIAATPVTVGLSWLSQRMLKQGATTRRARAHLVSMCAMASGLIFIVLVEGGMPPEYKAALFAIAGALSPLAITLGPVMLGEMVPASQCAALVAIFTAVGNVAGVIAPAVTGRLVQTYGGTSAQGYEAGMLCGAVLLLIGAVVGLRWLYPGRSRQTLSLATETVT